MKKIFMLLAVALPCLTFTACGDEEDDNTGKPGEEQTGKDETGKDESGKDESGKDESGKDDSNGAVAPAGVVAVDLGLSVKWANMNVGATSAEELGGHYSWGATETLSSYYWDTYKHCEGVYGTINKYNAEDKKITLDATDDAATANWGKNWRTPSKKEYDELLNKCSWTWTEQKGVKGYLVVGPNDNSIFLPAAGFYEKDDHIGAGRLGYYWLSDLEHDSPNYAIHTYFDDGRQSWSYGYRYFGYSVRPVSK